MLQYLRAGSVLALASFTATPVVAADIVRAITFSNYNFLDTSLQTITTQAGFFNSLTGQSLSFTDPYGSQSASLSLLNGGYVTASTASTAVINNLAVEHEPESQLVYNFEILGPTSTLVPIRLSSQLLTSYTGSGSAEASLVLSGHATYDDATSFSDQVFGASVGGYVQPGGVVVTTSSGYFYNNPSALSVNIDLPLILRSNTLYQILLDAGAFVNVGHLVDYENMAGDPSYVPYNAALPYTGTAFASVDPSITIDPAFSAHYKVYGGLLGPPIPTMSGTPEPGVWAMLVAGFGLVGTAVRRRQVAAV